jgi:hypothetical protein
MNIKRIAYAASFGKDDLSEYTSKLIKYTAKLAKQFDAISVREDSGVFLCEKFWNVDAVHLLDPTLLLDKDDYIQLVEQDSKNIIPSQSNLFVYILDRTTEKRQIVNSVSSALYLSAFEILPEDISTLKDLKNLKKHTFPSVTQWLQSFIDAEFIVTDSFHGTVFSIIFNKQFAVLPNQRRGITRIESLLKLLEIENRVISSLDFAITMPPIDYKKINDILIYERNKSSEFLTNVSI